MPTFRCGTVLSSSLAVILGGVDPRHSEPLFGMLDNILNHSLSENPLSDSYPLSGSRPLSGSHHFSGDHLRPGNP
jgi:hypothetical protein